MMTINSMILNDSASVNQFNDVTEQLHDIYKSCIDGYVVEDVTKRGLNLIVVMVKDKEYTKDKVITKIYKLKSNDMCDRQAIQTQYGKVRQLIAMRKITEEKIF